MGLDSESGKISCEESGIVTALKMVEEDAVETNEGQIAKTLSVCPYEGYKQGCVNNYMILQRRKELVPDEAVSSVMPEFVRDTCKKSLKKGNLERVSNHQELCERKKSASSKCNEHVNSETNRQKYVSLHHRKEFFCDICKRRSESKELMQRHMSLHQGEGYSCDICRKVFTSKYYLRNHINLHYGRGFTCDICNRMFPNKRNMLRHKSLHNEVKLACDICKKNFTKNECKENHICLHDGKVFACDICKTVFLTRQNIQNHMFHHVKVFPCEICKEVLTKEEFVQKHVSFAEADGFLCDLCKKMFTNKANWSRHMSLCRGEELRCDICKKMFRKKESLQNHMSRHHGKGFACDICKEVFTTSENMRIHMSVHKVEKLPYDTCKSVFTRRDCQEGQVSLRIGEDFPVDICKEDVEVQRFNTGHRESSENRIFFCHLCKKYFKLEFVEIHMSVHHELSGEGLTCDCCNKVFMEKTSLWRHLLIRKEMSERRTYFCPHRTCSKSFRSNRKLMNHIKSFHDGKKFESTHMGQIKDASSKVTTASKAGRKKGECLQEDIENLPALMVAPKEYKQRKKGMKTHGENPLTTLITSQKCINKREWLKEKENILHELLNLESPKSKRERNKTCKSVTIEAVPLDDVRENGDAATAALRNAEAQKRYNGVDSYNFLTDVRDWIHVMKRIMEEMFPMVKPSCL
ncbi:hypothetical protein B7P43_G00396 [Cryptotermes secundus]|uniref:C2H2-type domain-containing protein n=1 Tax=Cryptotermes secundus TaxID=105785 RepID=A0A2J7R8U3_9NEOP|nr:zinc finger protein draculin [Cryptotermes secundus]XP_023704130.1 zinc finger protein draculin [Cryptotermes secundus]PNF37251.1 hypothetical protein B7P43_G00396 [Cryptotermes secundus]